MPRRPISKVLVEGRCKNPNQRPRLVFEGHDIAFASDNAVGDQDVEGTGARQQRDWVRVEAAAYVPEIDSIIAHDALDHGGAHPVLCCEGPSFADGGQTFSNSTLIFADQDRDLDVALG
jgi:hypothetical protein